MNRCSNLIRFDFARILLFTDDHCHGDSNVVIDGFVLIINNLILIFKYFIDVSIYKV